MSVATLFFATLVHATLGFGTALVAMPILVLILPNSVATPLVGFVMLVTACFILVRDRHDMDWRAAGGLVVASLFGTPVGLWLLLFAPPGQLKILVGLLLVGYAAWQLARPQLPTLRDRHLKPLACAIAGFTAGALGVACNINGPPVVLYGALCRWPPDRFRATLQAFFLPAALIVVGVQGSAGLWTAPVFDLFFVALPVVLLANLLGRLIASRIPLEAFTRLLYWVLIVLGMSLIFLG